MAKIETVRPNFTLSGDPQTEKKLHATPKENTGLSNTEQKDVIAFLKGKYDTSNTARYMLPVLLRRYTALAQVEAGNKELSSTLEQADKTIEVIIQKSEGYKRISLNGLNNAVKRLEATFSSDDSESNPAAAVVSTLKQIIEEGAENKPSQSTKAKS